ncbi:hypothetical protein D3C81_10830 [compost metagenome]
MSDIIGNSSNGNFTLHLLTLGLLLVLAIIIGRTVSEKLEERKKGKEEPRVLAIPLAIKDSIIDLENNIMHTTIIGRNNIHLYREIELEGINISNPTVDEVDSIVYLCEAIIVNTKTYVQGTKINVGNKIVVDSKVYEVLNDELVQNTRDKDIINVITEKIEQLYGITVIDKLDIVVTDYKIARIIKEGV